MPQSPQGFVPPPLREPSSLPLGHGNKLHTNTPHRPNEASQCRAHACGSSAQPRPVSSRESVVVFSPETAYSCSANISFIRHLMEKAQEWGDSWCGEFSRSTFSWTPLPSRDPSAFVSCRGLISPHSLKMSEDGSGPLHPGTQPCPSHKQPSTHVCAEQSNYTCWTAKSQTDKGKRLNREVGKWGIPPGLEGLVDATV